MLFSSSAGCSSSSSSPLSPLLLSLSPSSGAMMPPLPPFGLSPAEHAAKEKTRISASTRQIAAIRCFFFCHVCILKERFAEGRLARILFLYQSGAFVKSRTVFGRFCRDVIGIHIPVCRSKHFLQGKKGGKGKVFSHGEIFSFFIFCQPLLQGIHKKFFGGTGRGCVIFCRCLCRQRSVSSPCNGCIFAVGRRLRVFRR